MEQQDPSARSSRRSRSSRRVPPAPGLAGALLVLLAGCGGGSGDATDASSASVAATATTGETTQSAARVQPLGRVVLRTADSAAPAPAGAVASPAGAASRPRGAAGPYPAITKGGTYSGVYTSTDPTQPLLVIDTTEPVVLQNCRLTGPGDLIRSARSGVDLTVRNCVGNSVPPKDAAGVAPGRFVKVEQPARLVVEQDTLNQTAGIYVLGDSLPVAGGVRIRFNKVNNIDGRYSDGKGGRDGSDPTRFATVQFVQFDKVMQRPASASGPVPGPIEVAWNEVVNQPDQSRVEDNVSLYLSRGTASQHIVVDNNYIQGAYPLSPATTPKYSGGGILCDGPPLSTDPDTATAFVDILDNQVVSTANYGIAIAHGHDVTIRDNRMVSSGLLPPGDPIATANIGTYVSVPDAEIGTSFFDATVTANYIAWMGWNTVDGQPVLTNKPAWFPSCVLASTVCGGDTIGQGTIQPQQEAAEYAAWQAKLANAGYRVGAQKPAP